MTTGTYGIIPPTPREPPRPMPAWAAAGMVAILAVTLLTFAWRRGHEAGRQEAAGRRLAIWGVQVEAGEPTSRIVGTGTPPAEPGPWKQVTLRYWVRRPDGAEPTDADVAASLRGWCAT